MSLSGSDVLALIERMHGDTCNEISGVSVRLERFTAELERLRQRELGVLSVLARIRMREIEGGELKAALDETGKRVKELLGRREGALAAVTEKLAAAERQQAALQQERAEQQRVVGAAERAVDEAEAAAQQALGADAGYRAKLDAAAASDKVADSAEAKATAAHADREQKGKPYEADALFAYLWGRGFGTPAAIAISSTTFTSRVSSSPVGVSISRAPVDHSTLVGPVCHAYAVRSTANAVRTVPSHGKACR